MRNINIRMYGFRPSEGVILRGFFNRLIKPNNSIRLIINNNIAVPDLAIVSMTCVEDMEASQHSNCAKAWAELRVRHHNIPCVLIYSKHKEQQQYPRVKNMVVLHRPFRLSVLAEQVQKLALDCYYHPEVNEKAAQQARILLVDDSPSLRIDMSIKLQDSNVFIDMAAHAEEALQKVASVDDYKLVFMDVMMPGNMDGYDACRIIKQLHPSLPVVMLTSKGSVFSRVRGKVARCNHYIIKPASKEILQEALATYVFSKQYVGNNTGMLAT